MASEKEIANVIRITIVVLAIVAMSVAVFLPPILAAMNWLFSWLVPIFWVVIFGLFWKRDSKVAVVTLFSAWAVNSAWSFSSLPGMLNMPDVPNAYVTLAVTLSVGVTGNLLSSSKRRGYFKSPEYSAVMAPASRGQG